MSPPSRRLRTAMGGLGIVLGLAGAGCHPVRSTTSPATPASASVDAPVATDDRFASAAHRLLRDGKRTPERDALLAAVVRRQLEHAAARFASGQEALGADAVVGAVLLVRVGDTPPTAIGPDGVAALDGALRTFGARGDEGRSLAVLAWKRSAVASDGVDARAIAWHLEAMRQWERDSRTGGPMQQLAAAQRQSVARALLEANAATLAEAEQSVGRWVERAAAINDQFQQTRQLPDRSEALEAFRALQTAAPTLAALHLRDGHANAAMQALEHSEIVRMARPGFLAALRGAAATPTSEAWRSVAREYGRRSEDADDDDVGLDPAVLDAALWGIAVEGYRIDPTSLAVAHLLASRLVANGMPEVAPLVLVDALGNDPAAVSLSGSLDLVRDALARETAEGGVASARRIVAAAGSLLALADDPRYRLRLRTSSAAIRRLLAGIELRTGHAREALDLMTTVERAEPTIRGTTALGALHRQLGNPRAAAEAAEHACRLSSNDVPDLDSANACVLLFELKRDSGDEPGARRALDDALATVLLVRRLVGSGEVAVRVETMLARILDGYGEHEQGSRAMVRALDLAERDRDRLPHTVLAAIARAVVRRDVIAARAALGIGIKAEIDRDSLVYGALWVGLLERFLGETSDGKVDRVLADAVNDEGWPMRLARWARGALTDAELANAARSHSDRVEAAFYAAMRARAIGAADGADRLRKVAQDPLIDLFEVRLARDLLAPQWRLPLPTNATLP